MKILLITFLTLLLTICLLNTQAQKNSVPKGIIEYFMKNNMQKSFENIAQAMDKNRDALNLACR